MTGVRLVGGGDCSGMPEILNQGSWKSVSSRSFSIRAAMVVCRDLGCGNPVSVSVTKQPEATSKSNRVVIECTGQEFSVSECVQDPVQNDPFILNIGTFVTCSESVRLVDGAGLCSGRVEVKSTQSWTAVCEADFNWKDDEVVCRELRCGTALVLQRVLFGKGEPIGTKEFQCKGSVKQLIACDTSPRDGDTSTCLCGSAVGLTCSGPEDVRLVNGNIRCDGIVEMFHSGRWRTMRTEIWSRRDAEVVCRLLKCGSAVVAKQTEALRRDPEWALLTDCGGSELALRDCAFFIHLPAEIITAVTCSESPIPAAISKFVLVPSLMLITCLSICLIFKKWGHSFIKNSAGQEAKKIELVFLSPRAEKVK